MIDMAQAEVGLRKSSGPIPYGWQDVKINHEFQRGDFCVIRQCSGSPEVLKIETQWAWKEWVGAFSYLG